jgi:Icc-related predicted phosphoesterase
MKFLAFTDLHGDKDFLKQLVQRAKDEEIDFVVCAGDLSVFGQGLKMVLKEFSQLGKKLYLIPGNHEDQEALEEAVKGYSGCVNFHGKAVKEKDYVFLGYGGNGFTVEDGEFRRIAREWYGKYNGQKLVLVTHGPPQGTKLDKVNNGYVGNVDYRRFIERVQPKLVISGHIHENAGAVDVIGKVKYVNPGWGGMVIELK